MPHFINEEAVQDAMLQVKRVVKFQSERDEDNEIGHDLDLLRDLSGLFTAFYYAVTKPAADPLGRKGRSDMSACLLAVAATCVRWYMVWNDEAAKDPRR